MDLVYEGNGVGEHQRLTGTGQVYVLGVDAAWTDHGSSGVALVHADPNNGGTVIRVAHSYQGFVNVPSGHGAPADVQDLLRAAEDLTGVLPLVVALDIPLSPNSVTSRREADNEVSRQYGGRGAAVHSPTTVRPGPVATAIYRSLIEFGYRWLPSQPGTTNPNERVFFETYPHPAIIEFLELDYRLPYKVGKRYDKNATPTVRRLQVAQNLDRLRAQLARRLHGLESFIPAAGENALGMTNGGLKNLEDSLDAAVCAVVALDYLAGHAVSYGDETSAIWLPRPTAREPASPASPLIL